MKRCFFVEKVAYKKKPGNEVELLKHMYSIIYSMGFRRSCLNCIRFRLLYCTALHCTALHCTALHCTALHCTALHCTALHCTALHCTALHCTALHCTALHCTALHCTALHCTALHCTALHCTALHCTALHWFGVVFILEFLTHSIVSGCPNRLLPNYRGSEVPTI